MHYTRKRGCRECHLAICDEPAAGNMHEDVIGVDSVEGGRMKR
jgi:hypothetical protein